MMRIRIITCFVLFISLISCEKTNRDKIVNKNELLATDYRLFQNTDSWELAKAVWDNNPNQISKEVKKNPKILNYQEVKYGNTLLNISIFNDDFRGFKELLRLGADPNIPDHMHCSSPLITACKDFENKIEYAEELLKYGADVNYVECNKGKENQKTNRTSLIYASIRGNKKLVELLLKKGAKINYINNNNEYALSAAMIGEHFNVVLYLLEHGASYNRIIYKRYNSDGSETPIYFKDLARSDERFKSSREYSQILKIIGGGR